MSRSRQVLLRNFNIIPFSDKEDSSTKQTAIQNSAKGELFKQMERAIEKVNHTKNKLDMDRSDDFIFVLFSLIHYKDPGLRSSATRLLAHMYNQTRTLGKTLCNLQIIEDRNPKNYIRAREHAYMLHTIGDTIEKWYENEDSTEMAKIVGILNKIYSSLFHGKAKKEIDEFDLNQLSLPGTDLRQLRAQRSNKFQGRKNKVSPSMLNIKPQGNLTDIHQYMIDSYEEKVDSFEQDLLRNTGIINSLASMALFDVETEGDERSNPSSLLIMKKIYRILAKICVNNEKNKEEISNYMESLILKHFQNESDFNTVFLIREMVLNNKSILLNDLKVNRVSRVLTASADYLTNEDIEKSYILQILADMVKYNEFILTKNQNSVLTLVISKEFNKIRVQFDNHQELESELAAKAKNKMLNKQLRMIESKKILVIPNEVCYVVAYVNLLTACSEGKNTFSENICQNLINLETLYKFIYVSDYCIVLKHALVMYFYHVYLDTDRDIPFHILEVFLSIVKNLLDQFEYYSKKKFVENEDNVESVEDFSILLHNSYKPFIKWVEDYLVLLIDCLDNVFKRNLNLIDDSEPAREHEKMILNLIDFTQIAMEKFPIEEITLRLARLIRGIYSRSPNTASAEKIKEKHRGIIDPKASTSIDMHNFDREAKRRKTVNRVQSAGVQNFAGIKKSRSMLTLYFNSKEFDLKCDEEFKQLVLEMRHIDADSRYRSENISQDSFCKCLMRYLSDSNDNPEELIYLLVLKVFRRHIDYTRDRDLNKPMTEWELGELKERSSEVIPKQNNLVRIGLVSLLCKIIFEVSVSSIIQETFLLAISLLVGGNKLTQETFFRSFESDTESSVLEKVKMHLTDSFEFVRKNMKEWNNLTLKLFYVRFDSTNSQKEAQEAEIAKAFRLLFIRRDIEQVDEHYQICLLVFKFMQLLCEGHNKDLQNMLRQQNGGNPTVSQKSINFISLTSGLWGTFIKFINPTCVELGSIMLDFVIESTQGPCELNQKEFYHNKVVDYSKDFMNDFTTDREFECKGFKGQSKAEINDLITKTIRMLNALLEANNDKLILDSISHNIEPSYLLRKLTAKFLDIFQDLRLDKEHKNFTVESLQSYLKPTDFEETFSEAFEIYFFIQNTEDSTGGYSKYLKEIKGLHKLVYDFFRHNTGQIEIIFQGDIQRLYFMIHPICRYLDDNQKRLFLDNVKRDTPTEKVTDFLMKAPMMFDRMDYISVLSSKVGFITQGMLTKVRDIAFLIAAIINIYILSFYEKTVVYMSYEVVSNSFTPYFMVVMGSLHILASVLMIVLWLFLNSKIILMDGWRDRFNKYKKILAARHLNESSRMTTDEAVEIQTIAAILNTKQIDMKSWEVMNVLNYFGRESGNPRPLPRIEYYVQNIMFIVTNSTFRFFLFYLTLSIAALGGNWVFLYCIHLLDIVVGFPHCRTGSRL